MLVRTRYKGLFRSYDLTQTAIAHYAISRRKRLDWSPVFDPQTPRKKALNLFKKNLLSSIEANSRLAKDSPEYEAIQALKTEGKGSTRELCEMIMQHRIEEHDIWEAIKLVNQNRLANVVVPKKIEHRSVQQGHKKPQLLKICPQSQDPIQKLLDKFQNAEARKESPQKTSVFPDRETGNEVNSSQPESEQVRSFDVRSLENYLQKAEQQESHRRKYAWEQTKKFNWEHKVEGPMDLSAGQILFSAPDKRVRKSLMEQLVAFFSRTSAPLPQRSNDDQPKELLVYELTTRTKRIAPLSNDNSLFNINYKDLFGIINSCGSAPEETLAVINRFESEGWKLIGDLYNQSQSIVFQRASPRAEGSSKGDRSSKINTWLWGSIAFATLYGTYRVVSAPKPVEDTQRSPAQ